MDKIWDRKSSRRSLAVVTWMKKPNDHAEPTKFERKKTLKKTTTYKSITMFTPVRASTLLLIVCHPIPTFYVRPSGICKP